MIASRDANPRAPKPPCFLEVLSPPWSQNPLHHMPHLNALARKGGGTAGGGGESPTSWATRLEMRTARFTRPFWVLGRRAPVPLTFLARAAMEGLAAPSLLALGPEALAST